jgi:hypothetical protein
MTPNFPRPGATDPVRDGSRYGSAPGASPRGCPVCTTPLPSRRARYCSDACKQRAYRLRQAGPPAADPAALATELQRRRRLGAQTIYECPICGERYLGEQRCPDCHRFCRALGLGGACPHCEQLLLSTELLA